MKTLRQQDGLSLVEMLVIIGMIGGGAMVVAQLGTNSAKIQTNLASTVQIEAVVSALSQTVANASLCKTLFENKTLDFAAGGATDVSLALPSGMTLAPSSTPAPGVTVQTVKIVGASSTGTDMAQAQLELQLKKANETYAVKRSLPLTFRTQTTGGTTKVVSCAGQNANRLQIMRNMPIDLSAANWKNSDNSIYLDIPATVTQLEAGKRYKLESVFRFTTDPSGNEAIFRWRYSGAIKTVTHNYYTRKLFDVFYEFSRTNWDGDNTHSPANYSFTAFGLINNVSLGYARFTNVPYTWDTTPTVTAHIRLSGYIHTDTAGELALTTRMDGPSGASAVRGITIHNDSGFFSVLEMD